MEFIEITVSTASDFSELVADVLWGYTVYGVAVSDRKDVLDLVMNRRETFDYIDEKLLSGSGEVLIKSYVALDGYEQSLKEIREKIKLLDENAPPEFKRGSLEIITREVDGDSWRAIWKEHFKPIHIGKFVVCPEWISYEPKADEKVIKIDSNMAFGTGEHETTSMCLSLLQELGVKGKSVADVGCGSGILGICALLFGADKAIMYDIDKIAVESAKHNAELNGVADRSEVYLNDLLEEETCKCDIVLSNIMSEVLIRLSKQIPFHIKQGGKLILSGIILSKQDEVQRVYEDIGFKLIKKTIRGEWVAMLFDYCR